MLNVNHITHSYVAGGCNAAYQTLFDATGSFVSNYIGVKNGAGQVRSTINNANIDSANNIGSVAQSDFMISNRAGSISADFSMFGKGGSIVSVGATLAINDINEQTIAEANNSNLTAKATDAANVIEVKDSVKDDAIVHNRILDKSLFRAGSLSESRITRNLRGVVVDATSTHAIADDVINVAAGARFDAAGIFNHNYISGATRASLKNTSIDGGKDVTVNAADWSNLGTFEIAAAASKSDAIGVAAGFIENGNTIDRKITAETFGDFSAKSKDRKTINADNFIVTADSKNGIVNTALGVGFMWAQGATLGLGINAVSSDLKATTSANVANLNVNHTGDATIKADNLSRAYRSLGAGSVSISKGASGSFGFTVDILDQKSLVSANIDNSTLKGKNATVNATNYTDTDAWLGSVGIAVNTTDIHAPAVGGAGTFAFDYFNATTQVGIKNSTLEEDTLKATALNTSNFNDGSGAVAWGNWLGAGVNSVYNSVTGKTTVDIEKSTLKTKTSSEISANDRRNVDTLVWNVSAGIVGLGVNTMLTYVNKNLSDDEDITAKVDKIINGLKEQQKNDKNISINKDRQHRDLNTWSIRNNAPKKNAGVNVNVKNSTIDGGEDLKVEAMEQNRIHQDAFAATGGEASVGVGIARIIVKHAVGTNFADSNLSGNNVSINTGVGNFDIANPVNAQMQADRQSKLNGSNYVQRKLLAWKSSLISDTAKNTGLYNFDFTFGLAIGDAATYGLASGAVAVLPTTIKKFGTINADFVNTGITAGNNLSINAADMTVTRSDNRAFSFATGGTVQVVNADSTNESDIAVNFKGNKGGDIKANNIEVTTLNKVNQTVETDEHSASIFVNVPVEFTETKDTSRSAINVDKNYTFESDKLLMSAANKPVLFADSLQNPYFAGTQLAYFGTLAKADSRAEINIGDGNAFNASEVTFEAQIGEKDTPTAKVDHSSVKILEVQASDLTSNAKAETNTSAKINVGNVEYDLSDVVINAENNAWRHVKTKSLQIIGVFEHGGSISGRRHGQQSGHQRGSQ